MILGGLVFGLFGRPEHGFDDAALDQVLDVATVQAIDFEKPPGIARQTRLPGFSFFDVALPMSFRARLGGAYRYAPTRVDALAYDRRWRTGPAVQVGHFVESRFSVGRELRAGVEFEVAWSAQNMFSMTEGPSMDRQTVGAFLRFTH